MFFAFGTGMGHGTLVGWAYKFGEFPDRSGSVDGWARAFPVRFALGQFVVGQVD